MAVEMIIGLTKANRRNLIRECLQNPSVSARRCNAPTAAALIDNAIYSVEEALRETPQDFFLKAAYDAFQVEYPQHFYSRKNNPLYQTFKQNRAVLEDDKNDPK